MDNKTCNRYNKLLLIPLYVVVAVIGICVVFASTELVATSYLNIGHNSSATGAYRKYSKKNQFVNYHWTKIESGPVIPPTLTVELQKKTLLGLNHSTVGTDVISSYVGKSNDTARFDGVGKNNNYRLYHSTWGYNGGGTGMFIADEVKIYTKD
jgi:hypothetical protein